MSWTAHSHSHSITPIYLLTLSLFISVIVWFVHYLLVCLPLSLFCVSGQSDLNCNNIVNWGYCEWRSRADQQPLFPAFASPHHSRKDTWFLSPHLTVAHFYCLLWSELRPCIKVETSPFFFFSLLTLPKKKKTQWCCTVLWQRTKTVKIFSLCVHPHREKGIT